MLDPFMPVTHLTQFCDSPYISYFFLFLKINHMINFFLIPIICEKYIIYFKNIEMVFFSYIHSQICVFCHYLYLQHLSIILKVQNVYKCKTKRRDTNHLKAIFMIKLFK